MTNTVWVDTKTGECWSEYTEIPEELVGRCELLEDIPGPPSDDLLSQANWIVEKIAEKRHKVESLKAQQAKQLRQVQADLRSFEWLFLAHLEDIARAEMKSMDKSTIHFDYGTAQVRKSKRWVIDNEDELIAYAEANAPQALRVTKKVLVSQLPEPDGVVIPGARKEEKTSFSVSTS